MAKATVLRCDACGTWDSDETPVRSLQVVGPRFDLCRKDRVFLMIHCGVDPTMAEKYQTMVDERIGVKGTMPALSAAKNWAPGRPADSVDESWASREERGEQTQEDAEAAEVPADIPKADIELVDESVPEAQDEPVVATAQKGTRRK